MSPGVIANPFAAGLGRRNSLESISSIDRELSPEGPGKVRAAHSQQPLGWEPKAIGPDHCLLCSQEKELPGQIPLWGPEATVSAQALPTRIAGSSPQPSIPRPGCPPRTLASTALAALCPLYPQGRSPESLKPACQAPAATPGAGSMQRVSPWSSHPCPGLRPLVRQSYPRLTSFPSPEALQDRALPGFCPLGRGLRASKGPRAGQGLARVPELERHPQPGMCLSSSTPEPSRDAPAATCHPPPPRGRLEAEQRTVGPGATRGAVRGEQAGRRACTAVGAGPWVQACGSQPLPGGWAAQRQLLPGDPAGLVGNCAGWGLSEPAQGLCAQPHTGKSRKPPGGEGAQCPPSERGTAGGGSQGAGLPG